MTANSALFTPSLRRFRHVGVFAALLAGVALSGCVFSTNETDRTSGQPVTAEQLGQIKPGATKDSVVSLIGLPTNRVDLGGGLDVWEYKYTQTHNKSADFIFIFSSDKSTHVDQTTSIEFKDGVVVKTWSK